MDLIPFRDFGIYPFPFWILIILLFGLCIEAVKRSHEAWSKPALALYGTVFLWYPGNMIYNGTAWFNHLFNEQVILIALCQVMGFLVAFRLAVPTVANLFSAKTLPRGAKMRPIHQQIVPLFVVFFILWFVLFTIGALRLEGDILPILWPPVRSPKVGLFVHGGIGKGWDFMVAAAQYTYQMCAVFFGVAAVLGKGKIRVMAITLVLLTWPYFMFGRVRNVQLSLIAPAVISFLLLGRSKIWVKTIVTIFAAVAVHIWFLLVIDYRSEYDMGSFFKNIGSQRGGILSGYHFGLEMLEELCYMNTFLQNGTFRIDYGMTYLTELLNGVPRTLWPNKPKLGFEYLMARGFTDTQVRGQEYTIYATIATGMIGQGVNNFGRFLGPLAAALLMSFWVGWLAKLWTERWMLGKAFLLMLGLGLTFNLGRGISLIALWPFVFGSILIWFWSKVATVQPIQYSRLPKSAREATAKK